MSQITVRQAHEDDRQGVLAFCQQIEEWAGYIQGSWDAWRSHPNGHLLIATIDDRPVGVLYLQMLTAGDVWLEGPCVDPAYRRRGVAKRLYTQVMQIARERDAASIRVMIESHNEFALRCANRVGMHRSGSCMLYEASPLQPSPKRAAPRERPQLAKPEDLDDIIDYLNSSSIFPLVGGFYTVAFTAYPITGEFLKEKIAAQQVYVLRRWERLDGLAIAERDGDTFPPVPYPQTDGGKEGGQALDQLALRRDFAYQRKPNRSSNFTLGYIDGTTIEPISLLAYDLRRRMGEMEIEEMQAFVPEMVFVHDAFSGAGYETQNLLFHIYEMIL